MICKFCGAEYPDKAKACYHCHSENPLMTAKRKADVLHAFDKEAEKMKKELPGKTIKKAHKILIVVLVGIILLTFTIGALWIGVSKSKQKLEYEIIQRNLVKMEELFQARDIDGLIEYYDNLTNRSYLYDKYGQIHEVGRFHRPWVYERYEDYLKYTQEYQISDAKAEYLQMREDYLYWVLDSGRAALQDMYLYGNDRVILGNEQFLLQWKDEMELFFLNEVGLTQEELLWLRTATFEGDEEQHLRRMAQMIMEGDDEAK